MNPAWVETHIKSGKGPNNLALRLITRRGCREVWCEIFRGAEEGKAVCDKFILCHDITTGDLFIATQRMGAWMEVDMYEIQSRLIRNHQEHEKEQRKLWKDEEYHEYIRLKQKYES